MKWYSLDRICLCRFRAGKITTMRFMENYCSGNSRFFKILILAFLLCICGTTVKAQSSISIDSLLAEIGRMQVSQDSFYFAGSFPTYRRYGESKKLKEDNAVFFTGLIAFTLKELKPYLNKEEIIICDSIIARAERCYPHFKNANGRPTFNFWRVNPPLVFPNSWFLNHFNETQQLPDDLDDTAILWLSMNPSDSIIRLVKEIMGLHANEVKGRIKNTFRKYRDLPAYSTWFGEKMPIDFDFCVLCNVLYFVHAYDLPENSHDSASVELLRRMIVNRDYITHPAFISPHYGRTPLLIYHAARLLGRFSIPALDTLKPRLLEQAYHAYHQSDNWLDSILLSTAVLRLGGKNLAVPLPNGSRFYLDNATFFVASFSAMLPYFWKKLLLHNQLIKYYFFCPAYRYTLFLENLVLRQAKEKHFFSQKSMDNLNFVVTFDP